LRKRALATAARWLATQHYWKEQESPLVLLFFYDLHVTVKGTSSKNNRKNAVIDEIVHFIGFPILILRCNPFTTVSIFDDFDAIRTPYLQGTFGPYLPVDVIDLIVGTSLPVFILLVKQVHAPILLLYFEKVYLGVRTSAILPTFLETVPIRFTDFLGFINTCSSSRKESSKCFISCGPLSKDKAIVLRLPLMAKADLKKKKILKKNQTRHKSD